MGYKPAPGTRFGDAVREARQRAGISLRELGERVKKADGSPMSPQYLNDIEHGRRNPPDEDVVRQMAKVLDLDVNVLLTLAGKEPSEIKEYLEDMPDKSESIGRLFRKAKEKKFSDWESLFDLIDKGGRKK